MVGEDVAQVAAPLDGDVHAIEGVVLDGRHWVGPDCDLFLLVVGEECTHDDVTAGLLDALAVSVVLIALTYATHSKPAILQSYNRANRINRPAIAIANEIMYCSITYFRYSLSSSSRAFRASSGLPKNCKAKIDLGAPKAEINLAGHILLSFLHLHA